MTLTESQMRRVREIAENASDYSEGREREFIDAILAALADPVLVPQFKVVATAWMQNGEMVNAFPHPPSTPEEWKKRDYDGYWKERGYSQSPLYKQLPPPPKEK